jgi:hypothetical protein
VLVKKLLLAALLSASCSGVLPYPIEAYQNGSSRADGGTSAPPATVDAAPPPPMMVDAAPPPPMMVDAAPPPPMVDAAPIKVDAATAASPDAPVVSTPDASVPTSEGGPPVLASCTGAQDAVNLLATRCGACHGARGAAKNLDLVTAGAGARMLNVKASCAGHVLIEGTADTPRGLLLDKLLGPVADCGERMPYGTPVFTDAEVSCVTSWMGQVISTQGR